MAETKQADKPPVLGLGEKKWQKRVVAQLVGGRWEIVISAAEGETILTNRNVLDLYRSLKVARRKQEFLYRRDLRKTQKKVMA